MYLTTDNPTICFASLGADLLAGQSPIQGVAVAPFAVSRGHKYTVYIASIGSLSSSDVVVASPSMLTAIGPSQPPTSLGMCTMGQISGGGCELATQAPLSLRIFWSPPSDTGNGEQDMSIIQGYTMALEAPSSVIQRKLKAAEVDIGGLEESFVQITGLVRVSTNPIANHTSPPLFLLASIPFFLPFSLSPPFGPFVHSFIHLSIYPSIHSLSSLSPFSLLSFPSSVLPPSHCSNSLRFAKFLFFDNTSCPRVKCTP